MGKGQSWAWNQHSCSIYQGSVCTVWLTSSIQVSTTAWRCVRKCDLLVSDPILTILTGFQGIETWASMVTLRGFKPSDCQIPKKVWNLVFSKTKRERLIHSVSISVSTFRFPGIKLVWSEEATQLDFGASVDKNPD